jgi:hypothetical protein
MENMPWVIQWYGDGWESLMNDAKMWMMIHGAAGCLWLMKIWCVQWKRRDNTPFRHVPCIFHKFHSHFFMKLCLKELRFLKSCGCRRCLRMNTKWNGRPVRWLLEPHSHRGQEMGVAPNPWIEAAVHGIEAHIIAQKLKIKSDLFNSQDHVHSVLGQKRRSACRILALRLNN